MTGSSTRAIAIGGAITGFMGKHRPRTSKVAQPGLTLGLDAFEKISAVEGIHLAEDMKRDLQALNHPQMSAAQRTRFILTRYGKASD